MIVLPLLHFFCIVVYVYLAVLILNRDSKTLLNRSSFAIMICFALWNFGDVFIHNPDSSLSEGTLIILQNISSLGWASFATALLCFSLAFSKRGKMLEKKWFLLLIFILPLFFIFKQWTNYLLVNPVRQPYGWSFNFASKIWTWSFYAYYFLFTMLSLTIIYQYGRKTKELFEKKQARILSLSLIASLLVGTIVDALLPEIGIYTFPSVGNLCVSILAIGFFYVIFKYRFLTITPSIAAENIINSMDELLILLNQKGNILSVNQATINTLQYTREELIGKSVKVLLQEEYFKDILLEKIAKEEIIKNQDSNFLTKNEKIVPVIYSSSPLKNEDGIVIGTVFLARDITQHEQTRGELIKAKEKAEESDRLKSAFLANMSHEIRTPMNGILGFAALLKEPNLSGEEQQEFINIIESSGTRMLNIINDIISISKVESGQMEVLISETNINDQIEYIYTFFKPEVQKKGMKLLCKKTLTGEQAIIKTDREKVYAILTNLVKNAIKFTAQGSIEFGYEKKGVYLEFFVKDSGPGVRNEQKDFIFERFRQGSESLTRNYEGAGLGLSISKAYVEMLGGKIWLVSDMGKGSIFNFTLPYITSIEEKSIENRAELSGLNKTETYNLKVLIAEDDDISEKLMTNTVKIYSKEILKAINGFEAVEMCRQNSDLDLVLMDIKMPIMDGYEATREIRKFNSQVVIIAQSAYALSGDREKAIEAGCTDYISKPMNLFVLKELIRKYFNKRPLVEKL